MNNAKELLIEGGRSIDRHTRHTFFLDIPVSPSASCSAASAAALFFDGALLAAAAGFAAGISVGVSPDAVPVTPTCDEMRVDRLVGSVGSLVDCFRGGMMIVWI